MYVYTMYNILVSILTFLLHGMFLVYYSCLFFDRDIHMFLVTNIFMYFQQSQKKLWNYILVAWKQCLYLVKVNLPLKMN